MFERNVCPPPLPSVYEICLPLHSCVSKLFVPQETNKREPRTHSHLTQCFICKILFFNFESNTSRKGHSLTVLNATLPANSKMAKRGLHNDREGMVRGLTIGHLALWTTYERPSYEKRMWEGKNRKMKILMKTAVVDSQLPNGDRLQHWPFVPIVKDLVWKKTSVKIKLNSLNWIFYLYWTVVLELEFANMQKCIENLQSTKTSVLFCKYLNNFIKQCICMWTTFAIRETPTN